MKHKEHIQASIALVNWFKSQGIDPADAQCVMSLITARQIVNRCKTAVQMEEALAIIRDLLMVHIGEELIGD